MTEKELREISINQKQSIDKDANKYSGTGQVIQIQNTGMKLIEDVDDNIQIPLTLSRADLKYLRNLLFSSHNERLLPVIDAAINEHKQVEPDPIEDFCQAVDETMAKNQAEREKIKNEKFMRNDAMEQVSIIRNK